MNNIYELIEKAAASNPDHTALIFGENQISYSGLKEAADRLAAGLRALGMHKGERIALMLPNVPQFVMSYFALHKLGVIIVPVSIYYKADEIHHLMEDSEAHGIIYWEKFREEVIPAVKDLPYCRHKLVLGDEIESGELRLNFLMESNEPFGEKENVNPDDTALIVYTAGATGRPNGAELSHANIIFDVEACLDVLELKPEHKTLAPIPFYHPLGHTLTLSLFSHACGSIVLIPKFEPDIIFKLAAFEKPTHIIAVPSMIRELLLDTSHESNLSGVRYVIVSGEALKEEELNAFETRFDVPVLEGYGLTEASPMVSLNRLNIERVPGSIGLPLPGMDLKIVNEEGDEVKPGQIGEIIVKGPNVMKGYLNRPEATRKALVNGWLHTGDLARLEENGYAFIVVRKKNVIIKSGFNVYPREVEKYLLAHPKIAEAVIAGLPDPNTGEEIHAAIVLKEKQTATSEEIISYSKERMAAYKCPKTVCFLNDIPKGPAGRILRNKIKEIIAQKNGFQHN